MLGNGRAVLHFTIEAYNEVFCVSVHYTVFGKAQILREEFVL